MSKADYTEVYGKTFALYGKADLDEFIEPLAVRYRVNGIDPQEVFGGKHCLDAGCGGGRGAIFMLKAGAASVTLHDVSPLNIDTAMRNVAMYGFTATPVIGSLLDTGYADEVFDVVWCNGVLHHTEDPERALCEITRVLKIGGKAWLYLYGGGGMHWYVVQRCREILAPIPSDYCLQILSLTPYPLRWTAKFIDDWKTPYCATYRAETLTRRLVDLGYDAEGGPLRYGNTTDSSHRRQVFPVDAPLIGEGDLRYLVTRTAAGINSGAPLPGGEYGEDIAFAPQVKERLKPLFDQLASLVTNRPELAVLASARALMTVFNQQQRLIPFDLDAVVATCTGIIADVEAACVASGTNQRNLEQNA